MNDRDTQTGDTDAGTVELSGCPITFTDPETRRCPFPAYHKLREEQPVYKDPVSGSFVLTRYADVRKAAMNTKTLSCKTGVIQTRKTAISGQVDAMFEEHGYLPLDTLVTNDPPSHRTYRTLVDKAFTRDKVMSLEPQIEKAVTTLIDGFINKDEIDFFDEFAMRLPLTVFTEILGVTDRDIEAQIVANPPSETNQTRMDQLATFCRGKSWLGNRSALPAAGMLE